MRGHSSLFHRSRSRFYAGPAGQPDFAFTVIHRQKPTRDGSEAAVLLLVEEGVASVVPVVATGRCPHPRFSHRVLSRPRSAPQTPASSNRAPQLPRSRHGRLPTQIRASRAPSRKTLRRSLTQPRRPEDFPVSTTDYADRPLKLAAQPLWLGTDINTGPSHGAASSAALPSANRTSNKKTTKTSRAPNKAPTQPQDFYCIATKTKSHRRHVLALRVCAIIIITLLNASTLCAPSDCSAQNVATHHCHPLPSNANPLLWDSSTCSVLIVAFSVPAFHLDFPCVPAFDTFSKQPP